LDAEVEAQEAVGLKDNVETVRRGWEAAVRRPKPDFATVNAFYDLAHELVSVMDALQGGTRRGAQGFRDWLAEMGETLESWEASIEEVTVIDEDRVLLVWESTVRGKRSGAPGGQRGAAIMTVRNGKITRTENYLSREQALEAVDRSEQVAHGDPS
jgi:ketosteroid isomerase-like protein